MLTDAERGPRDEEDVACGMPRKEEVMKMLREMNGEDKTDGEEMDAYIRFCEGALLGAETFGRGSERGGGGRGMLCGEEEYRLFAGEEYKTWDGAEGGEYGLVIERASRLLGVQPEYLNGIVRTMDKLR